jgi:hypothetical protein
MSDNEHPITPPIVFELVEPVHSGDELTFTLTLDTSDGATVVTRVEHAITHDSDDRDDRQQHPDALTPSD